MLQRLSSSIPAITLLAFGCAAPAPDGPRPLPPGAEEAAATITASGLEETIRYLSSDELGGRGPGSPGDEATQQYLIQRLEELGFEPAAADGGWLQPFDIVGGNVCEFDIRIDGNEELGCVEPQFGPVQAVGVEFRGHCDSR